MGNRRPVGSSESEVLKNLYRIGGTWRSEGGRPLWESMHWTRTLLASLTVKGYVEELTPDQEYQLSHAGFQLVMQWGTQIHTPPPARSRQHVHFPAQGNIRRASPLRRPAR